MQRLTMYLCRKKDTKCTRTDSDTAEKKTQKLIIVNTERKSGTKTTDNAERTTVRIYYTCTHTFNISFK